MWTLPYPPSLNHYWRTFRHRMFWAAVMDAKHDPQLVDIVAVDRYGRVCPLRDFGKVKGTTRNLTWAVAGSICSAINDRFTR